MNPVKSPRCGFLRREVRKEMARMRLQRYIAQCGVMARRKAEALIANGKVSVNGRAITQMGIKIDPETDRVLVCGKIIHPEPRFYVLLNKPKGCITAVRDDRGRSTVMDYVVGVPANISPVGRLDYYSEGVLLLTNDGELSAALQHPGNHIEKVYHVKIRGEVSMAQVAKMRRGVRLRDGMVTRPAEVTQLESKSRHTWLAMTLTEGKSRQIRRMADSLGLQVIKLQRVSFAGIQYWGLRVGDARELSQQEVDRLRELVGLEKDARARSLGKWYAKREQVRLARVRSKFVCSTKSKRKTVHYG